MKRLILVLTLLLLLVLTSACGNNETVEDNYNHLHTNIVSDESRTEVKECLKKAGVSDERIDVFFSHVTQFNDAVDTSVLASDFEEADMRTEFYDPYALQDMWMEKMPDFNGYNCRITAFSLFGEFIEISGNEPPRDADLFMDEESLEADPSALIGDNAYDNFRSLFSVVPTENTKDINIHAEKIKDDFENRGISFKSNDKIKLVTLWQHNQWSEEENELFVGHTGILIRSDRKKLVFIEKLAFQEPYQATIFNSENELYDYLMNKYNVSWDQPTAEPFVMINNDLLVKK